MLKSIDKDWFFVYNKKVVKATYLGVAQLVACLNGVQEAASSNLATQTKRNPLPSWDSGFLLYWFILRVARLYLWLYCVLIFPFVNGCAPNYPILCHSLQLPPPLLKR